MEVSETIRRIKAHFREHDDGRPTPYLDEAVRMALDLLEKKEAGLIVELPVPIGTEVWYFQKVKGCQRKAGEECNLDCIKCKSRRFQDKPETIKFGLWFLDAWGKTVFATREEAEVRLKELRGEE